jgi:hypothetical protein
VEKPGELLARPSCLRLFDQVIDGLVQIRVAQLKMPDDTPRVDQGYSLFEDAQSGEEFTHL